MGPRGEKLEKEGTEEKEEEWRLEKGWRWERGRGIGRMKLLESGGINEHGEKLRMEEKGASAERRRSWKRTLGRREGEESNWRRQGRSE